MSYNLVNRIIGEAMKLRQFEQEKFLPGNLKISIRINRPTLIHGRRTHRVIVKRHYADDKSWCGAFAKHHSFPVAVRIAAEMALDLNFSY